MKGQSHCGMGLCPNKRSQIRTRAPMCCCPRVTRLSPIRSCKLAARGVQQCASWAPTRQAHMPSSSTWLHTSMCMLSRSRRGPRTDMNRTSRCCDTGTKPAQTFVRRALNFHDLRDRLDSILKHHADASLLGNSHGECACTPKSDAPVTIEMYHV